MIAVINVIPLENHLLQVTMSDGKVGTFDILPYCQSDYFKEILDDEYFKQVRLFFRGIGWPHGQDIGPDTINEELVLAESLAIA